MGLLDGNLDPQSASVLALAGGLLSPGSFGQGLSRGIAGQQSVLANDAELQLKRQQVLEAQQAQQLRELQMQRTRQQLQFGAQYMGGAAPASQPSIASASMGIGAATSPSLPDAGAGATNTGGVGPTNDNASRMSAMPPTQVQSPISKFAALTADQVAGLSSAGVIGKEQVDLWKTLNTGTSMQPGWRVIPGQAPTYLGDPTKGITLDSTGKVVTMPGAPSALATMAGATKGGELDATNARTPIPLDRIDRGLPTGVTPYSSIADLLNPPASSGAPTATPLMRAQIPTTQQKLVADSAAQGFDPRTLKINGQPAFAAGAPTAAGGFKSPADLAAENLAATQAVHADTDPVVKLRTDLVEKSHAANQATLSNLADTTNNEAELVARNNRIKPYLDQLSKSGGWGYDQRVNFANNLKNSGLPYGPEVASWITNGDPAAAKTISNQLASAAITNMLDTLNKEGKPNRVIFQALHDEQEALGKGKDVLGNVMNLQAQLYQQHQAQLDKLTDLIAAPDYNPVKLQNQFAIFKAKNIGSSPTPAQAPTMRWNPKTQKIEAVN